MPGKARGSEWGRMKLPKSSENMLKAFSMGGSWAGRLWEAEEEEEEEEAGGDSSSDLAESLCQDFALPRLAPSLSLSLFSHTHTQRYRSEIGSLPENSSGSSESGGGGETSPPLLA